MQKVRKICLMIVFIIALAGVALAIRAVNGDEETAKPMSDEEIGQMITDANNEDTLMEKYGSIGANAEIHTKDGAEVSWRCYRTPNYYYMEEAGAFVRDDNGDVCGYDPEDDSAGFRYLFLGDSYEEFRESCTFIDWNSNYSSYEPEIGDVDEEGKRTVKLSAEVTDEDKDALESNGYTDLKDGKLLAKYTVDGATGEILNETVHIKGKDVKKTLLSKMTIQHGGEKPEVDQEILDRIFSEDVRNLKVIVDPGSANEKTYTQTVGKGCRFMVMFPYEYDQNMYLDEACTRVLKEDDVDTESDMMVYARSEAGEADNAEESESTE